MTEPIRILLADDHRIIQEGLKALIHRQTGMAVVGQASNGTEAMRLARETKPDVILMDIAMPGMNGIEATREVLSHQPEIKIIALSMHSAKNMVKEMLRAGASGFLLKDCAFEELTKSIQTVMSGQIYLSPGITGLIVENFVLGHETAEVEGGSELTSREREVLKRIAQGASTKEIAFDLEVSAKTIETYRRQIMQKLQIFSIAELTRYAILEGIIPLE